MKLVRINESPESLNELFGKKSKGEVKETSTGYANAECVKVLKARGVENPSLVKKLAYINTDPDVKYFVVLFEYESNDEFGLLIEDAGKSSYSSGWVITASKSTIKSIMNEISKCLNYKDLEKVVNKYSKSFKRNPQDKQGSKQVVRRVGTRGYIGNDRYDNPFA